jgi:hypothetical protein
MQLVLLGLIGTFIMKRFPTSFAIGFLLGIVVVFVNQNIIYMITFTQYNNSNSNNNSNGRLYSAFSLLVAAVLSIFGALLFHFQKYIIVAPIDAKGFTTTTTTTTGKGSAISTANTTPITTNYQRYDDGSEA